MNFKTLSRIIAEFPRKIFADYQSRNHRNFIKKWPRICRQIDFNSRKKFWRKINFSRQVLRKRTEESCPILDNVLRESRGVCKQLRKYSAFLLRIFRRIFEDIWKFSNVCEDIIIRRWSVFLTPFFEYFLLEILFIFSLPLRICSEKLFS